MKTSVLISSIAALSLLVTFAVTPLRHGEDKMNLASATDISFAVKKRATMLPGVIITPRAKVESVITVPTLAAEDFSYLEFEVAEYMDPEAKSLGEVEVLPEPETYFGYLKFNINDYITGSEITSEELAELPVNEFEYLRFDVNKYINDDATENSGIGELPSAETTTESLTRMTVPGETATEFGYLKFDVNEYYTPGNQGTEEQFELPGE